MLDRRNLSRETRVALNYAEGLSKIALTALLLGLLVQLGWITL